MPWVNPENLGRKQHRRDSMVKGRQYYVYVLQTDFGNYVGHTGRLNGRLQDHRNNKVKSTSGTRPEMVYISAPRKKRRDAQEYEAALKSFNHSLHPRFFTLTGIQPEKFISPSNRVIKPIKLEEELPDRVVNRIRREKREAVPEVSKTQKRGLISYIKEFLFGADNE